MNATFAVVLAAGKGTRMKSDKAKVLHELADRPMLSHVLSALEELGVEETVVVVGHQADAVSEICREHAVQTVLQSEQLGTGHAVEQARPVLEGREGLTLILSGDVPLLRARTLRGLEEAVRKDGAAACVLTAITEDASGYGRILRGAKREILGIVEEKDASEEQRRITEYNTGTYCFKNALLWPLIRQLDTDNAQGEFYLTDLIALLVRSGERVQGVVCEDEREVQGVNTLEDLARARSDWEEIHRG
ncbi:MAG TPA: NTP transferase domain-containing protein [Candidatus Krumholzibacteria bacterium]|nr:NTP transferase domain-containing protein [Candidatus Krumholzibacteria bacterium]